MRKSPANCAPGCCAPAKPRRSQDAQEDLAVLAKALGHLVRVHILRLLIEKNTCVCGDIVASLPLAQATVSQHLKVLKHAGLFQGEIDHERIAHFKALVSTL
jgi:ArsR family transcriptional regulator